MDGSHLLPVTGRSKAVATTFLVEYHAKTSKFDSSFRTNKSPVKPSKRSSQSHVNSQVKTNPSQEQVPSQGNQVPNHVTWILKSNPNSKDNSNHQQGQGKSQVKIQSETSLWVPKLRTLASKARQAKHLNFVSEAKVPVLADFWTVLTCTLISFSEY